MKNEFNNNSSKEKLTDAQAAEYGSRTSINNDGKAESGLEKIPYPKSVFFIITNEFCERFSYYGMKAVLALYLQNVLRYSEDKSTVIYHTFSMLCYFTPVFGAIIADSFLGKFRTILYLSIVYALGNIVLSLASITPLNIPLEPFSLLGLLLIAIGTGGIKPCVSAFGGDQFILPQQALQLASFFSIFYFSINAGSLLSTFITPIFRKDVQCFDAETCYPLAFGVPAVLMITSLLVFVVGYKWYIIRKPDGNITVTVASCVAHAVSERSKSTTKREHWLDYASSKYDSETIESVKTLLKILVLYIPLPVFWALFDQQGSRWTFQATRMDGEIFGYVIKPDQMQVLNPLLILAFIPIFDQGIYPALGKIGLLKKPLQRLTMGGVLAGAAFVISGFLEIKLETTYAVKLANNEAHLNFINDLPCPLQLQIGENSAEIEPFGQYIIKQIEAGKTYSATFKPQGSNCTQYTSYEATIEPKSYEAKSYLISGRGESTSLVQSNNPDLLRKDGEGASMIKFIFIGFEDEIKRGSFIKFKVGEEFLSVREEVDSHDGGGGHGQEKMIMPSVKSIRVTDFDSAVYKTEPIKQVIDLEVPANETANLTKKEFSLGVIQPKQGGNYLYVVKKGSAFSNTTITEYVITQPNSVHMLWLVPQYVVITVAEIMFSITGLQFAFSQAPPTMKSVLQACWLLTVAFGNVIVIFIAEFKLFEEQYKEFFLYSGLMFVDMIIFAVLAYFYKPTNFSEEKKNDPPLEMRENKMRDDYDP